LTRKASPSTCRKPTPPCSSPAPNVRPPVELVGGPAHQRPGFCGVWPSGWWGC
jgi:hypothetical protein